MHQDGRRYSGTPKMPKSGADVVPMQAMG